MNAVMAADWQFFVKKYFSESEKSLLFSDLRQYKSSH